MYWTFFWFLFNTQGIVQEYVDNMFQAILSAETIPKPIKYLFDFFESQANRHDLTSKDADLVHIWKSNMQVSMLKNAFCIS